MIPETDPNTFTQKDLMQHLLHAAQHSVTREEMAGQFSQAEQINRERFEQTEKINQERFDVINKQFEQVERINQERFDMVNKQFEQVNKQFGHVYKEFDGIKQEIKTNAVKHDRLLWALFIGMLAIFFKDVIIKMFA